MAQEGSSGGFDGVIVIERVATIVCLEEVAIDETIEFGEFQRCSLDDEAQIPTLLRRLGPFLDSISDIVQYHPEIRNLF